MSLEHSPARQKRHHKRGSASPFAYRTSHAPPTCSAAARHADHRHAAIRGVGPASGSHRRAGFCSRADQVEALERRLIEGGETA